MNIIWKTLSLFTETQFLQPFLRISKRIIQNFKNGQKLQWEPQSAYINIIVYKIERKWFFDIYNFHSKSITSNIFFKRTSSQVLFPKVSKLQTRPKSFQTTAAFYLAFHTY